MALITAKARLDTENVFLSIEPKSSLTIGLLTRHTHLQTAISDFL